MKAIPASISRSAFLKGLLSLAACFCGVVAFAAAPSISGSSEIIGAFGKFPKATYTIKLSSGKKYSGSVSWKSSDTKVATIDKNGKLAPKRVGKVTISATVKINGVKYTCKKTVTMLLAKDFKLKGTTNLKVKKSTTFTVMLYLNNGKSKKYTGKFSHWWVSNKKLATVTQNGKLTAKAKGKIKVFVVLSGGVLDGLTIWDCVNITK